MSRLKYILVSFIISLIAVSCEKLHITDAGADSWYSNLEVNFNWNTYKDAPKTDMCLLLARIVDTKHYYFMTDSNAKYLGIRPYEALSDTVVPQLPFNNDSTAVRMAAGEYAMFVVSSEKGKSEILNMGDFLNDPTNVGLTSLIYTYRPMKKEDLPRLGDFEWVEHSTLQTYTNDGPKYFGMVDYLEIPDDKSNVCANFNMEMLTQKVDFEFDIEIKQNSDYKLYVRDVEMELSGIIEDINLYDMTLSYDTYGKMFIDGGIISNSLPDAGTSYIYKGSVDALGVIYDDDFLTVAGPGVVRIGFLIDILDSDGNLYAKRLVFATKNICREIKDAELTEFENNIILRQKNKSAEIDLDKLIIDADAVVKGSGGGVMGWDESNIDENI